MSKSDYVPTQQEQKASWSLQFSEKSAELAPTLGLSPADLAELLTSSTNISQAVKDSISAKAAAKSVVAQKMLVIDNEVKSLRRWAQAIKAHKNYTEAIGEALGIVGSEGDADRDGLKPELSARAASDHVRLSFTKKGIDGVHVYGRRKGEGAWQLLGTDYFSPYTDHRPLAVAGTPETREYMFRGIIHDEEVGVDSDIVSVLFGG